MAKYRIGGLVIAIAAILLFAQVLYSGTRSQAIAQRAFRYHCNQLHDDYSSYHLAYDKAYLGGHYYDFTVATPAGLPPGTMGFYRVYVTGIGTTSVRGFKGLPR